jgi:hypothetical protein
MNEEYRTTGTYEVECPECHRKFELNHADYFANHARPEARKATSIDDLANEMHHTGQAPAPGAHGDRVMDTRPDRQVPGRDLDIRPIPIGGRSPIQDNRVLPADRKWVDDLEVKQPVGKHVTLVFNSDGTVDRPKTLAATA